MIFYSLRTTSINTIQFVITVRSYHKTVFQHSYLLNGISVLYFGYEIMKKNSETKNKKKSIFC